MIRSRLLKCRLDRLLAIWGTGGSGGSLWGSASDNSKDGLWEIKQDSGSSKKKSSGAANVVDRYDNLEKNHGI